MIRSMTGFGAAASQIEGVHYAVEVRSVNNRYFKTAIRLPEELVSLEPELEGYLRSRFTRGSITLHVSYRDASAEAAYEINQAALDAYLANLNHVQQQATALGAQPQITLDLAGLLALPGVVQPPSQAELADRHRQPITELLNEACDRMQAMRITEGRGLVADLQTHSQYIRQRLQQTLDRAPAVLDEYHAKLRQRVEQLLSRAQLNLAELDVAREVALYAERCDIAEEAQRLDAHLQQLVGILTDDSGEAVGRTLDFIAQELLREANTIASKSNDAQIARLIVEIKGAIDRIKEQVQNIE